MLIASHIWQVVARPLKRMVLETAVISLSQKAFWKAEENWNQSNWNNHSREEEVNG